MKKKLLLMCYVLAFCTAVLIILHWNSQRSLNTKNHFNRLFVFAPRLRQQIDLKGEEYYFSGWMNDTCYLAKTTRPFELLALFSDSTRLLTLSSPSRTMRYGRITIDSPYFHLADLSNFFIYRGLMKDRIITDTLHRGKLFSEQLPIGNSTLLRDLNSEGTEYQLSKENYVLHTEDHAADLIQKQEEGLFSTDGVLCYDHKKKLLTYIYFYRNEFFTTDTSLHLLQRGHTIDTVTLAKIKVATITSSHSITLAAPPHIVNRNAVVSNGYLYNASNLMADNETASSFSNSDVIDVYTLPEGKYEFSFYLPRINNERLLHFIVHDTRLYAIKGPTLFVYDLHTSPH